MRVSLVVLMLSSLPAFGGGMTILSNTFKKPCGWTAFDNNADLFHKVNEVLMMGDDDKPLKNPDGSRYNPLHKLDDLNSDPHVIKELNVSAEDKKALINASGLIYCPPGQSGHFTIWGKKTEVSTQAHVIRNVDGTFKTGCKIFHQGNSEIPDTPLVLTDSTVKVFPVEGRDPDDWPVLIRPPRTLVGKDGKPLPGVKLVDEANVGFDYKQKALLYSSLQTYGDDGRKAKNDYRDHGLAQQCRPHADKDRQEKVADGIVLGDCWVSKGVSGGALYVPEKRDAHDSAGNVQQASDRKLPTNEPRSLRMAGMCSEGGYSNMDGTAIHKDRDPHKLSGSICIPFTVQMIRDMEDFDKKEIHIDIEMVEAEHPRSL